MHDNQGKVAVSPDLIIKGLDHSNQGMKSLTNRLSSFSPKA
jgi:hypothetical protein